MVEQAFILLPHLMHGVLTWQHANALSCVHDGVQVLLEARFSDFEEGLIGDLAKK